jgi:hypothetical protein
MKIQYDFFLFIFERLGRMHENKLLFFNVLMKTRYFNTGFVSLQYKNTNQFDQNKVKNLRKITDFFEIIFEENFFFGLGWTQQVSTRKRA